MSTKTKTIRPRRFVLPRGDSGAQLLARSALIRYLDWWPADRYCKVTVSEGKEKRSEEQNSLIWVWNHDLVSAHDDSYDADYYHATNKLVILLPLMCHTWDRWREEGEFIHGMIASQTTERARLRIALDCIESSELHVDECQLYLTRVQQHWELQGTKLIVQAPKQYASYPEAQ